MKHHAFLAIRSDTLAGGPVETQGRSLGHGTGSASGFLDDGCRGGSIHLLPIYPRSSRTATARQRRSGRPAHAARPLAGSSSMRLLAPSFPSPMADFGYDVSTTATRIRPFGTLADLDALTRIAHARGTASPRRGSEHTRTSTRFVYRWRHAEREARLVFCRDPAQGASRRTAGRGSSARHALDARPCDGAVIPSPLPAVQQPDLTVPPGACAPCTTCFASLERGVDGFRMDVIQPSARTRSGGDPPDLRGCARDLPSRCLHAEHLLACASCSTVFPGDRMCGRSVQTPEGASPPTTVARRADWVHLPHRSARRGTPPPGASHRAHRAWLAPRGRLAHLVLSNHDTPDSTGMAQRARARAAAGSCALRGTRFVRGRGAGARGPKIPRGGSSIREGGRLPAPLPWDRAADMMNGREPWLPFAAETDRQC